MNAAHTAMQAFWDRLSQQDQAWLTALGRQPAHTPPGHWVRWGTPQMPLGWLSPERASWLATHLPHCQWIGTQELQWAADALPRETRSAQLHAALCEAHSAGLLSGWRDESYAWWPSPATPPQPRTPCFVQAERAGFRHLGLMSHAVHILGFLPDGDQWCGRRALHKATDPGRMDNLAAGGLPVGETALQAAVRELHEEAGLSLPIHRLRYAGAVRTQRLEAEGWHDERLLVFTLALHETEAPCNLDGEVQGFVCLSPSQCLQKLREQDFTPDAAMALACALGLTPDSAH